MREARNEAARKGEWAGALKKFKERRKGFGFTAGMLKGTLTEGRREK